MRTIARFTAGGVIVLLVAVGCDEAPTVPPSTSEVCQPIPAESVAVAVHAVPACARSGWIAYFDLGVVCRIHDFPGEAYGVEDSLAGLWMLNPKSGENRRILPFGDRPSWSPQSDRIVANVRGTLVIVNVHTGTFQQITFAGAHFFPAWSPDGHWIAYDDGAYTWKIRSTGEAPLQLGGTSESARMPAWSFDGTRIVHVRYRSTRGGGELFDMDSLGADLRQLTANGMDNSYPACSPDGQRIAFVGNPADGPPNIWIINSDGSQPKQITTGEGTHPAWTADGRGVIYSRYTPPCGSRVAGVLWVVDIETLDETQVTQPWPQSDRCNPARSTDREPGE